MNTTQTPTKMQQTCINLRLHRSTFEFIENKDDRSYQICCVCSATNAANVYQLCCTIVHTATETGKWNDRYLCRTHYPYVLQALNNKSKVERKERVVQVKTQADENDTGYKEILIQILSSKPGHLFSRSLLIEKLKGLRHSTKPNSIQDAIQKLKNKDIILVRQKYGASLYRLQDIPLKTGMRVTELMGKPSERHGWILDIEGERVIAYFPGFGKAITCRDRLDFIDNIMIDRQIAKLKKDWEERDVKHHSGFVQLDYWDLDGLIKGSRRDKRIDGNRLLSIGIKVGLLPRNTCRLSGKERNKVIDWLDLHYRGWRNGGSAVLGAR